MLAIWPCYKTFIYSYLLNKFIQPPNSCKATAGGTQQNVAMVIAPSRYSSQNVPVPPILHFWCSSLVHLWFLFHLNTHSLQFTGIFFLYIFFILLPILEYLQSCILHMHVTLIKSIVRHWVHHERTDGKQQQIPSYQLLRFHWGSK